MNKEKVIVFTIVGFLILMAGATVYMLFSTGKSANDEKQKASLPPISNSRDNLTYNNNTDYQKQSSPQSSADTAKIKSQISSNGVNDGGLKPAQTTPYHPYGNKSMYTVPARSEPLHSFDRSDSHNSYQEEQKQSNDYSNTATAVDAKKKQINTKAQVTPTTAPAPVIATATAPDDYIQTANKLKNKNGWINNRNSDFVQGIGGYVKGVYETKSHIYIMIELRNTTDVNYGIKSILFISNLIRYGKKPLRSDEQFYTPIWRTNLSVLEKKSKQKLIFVFNKFTIDDKKNLLFIMEETQGERTLILQIKQEHIAGAKHVK